jgi:cell division protein FtsZ
MSKTTFAPTPAKIKAIGMGGGGSNAITRMVREGIRGVDFVAMNTDAQALALAEAPLRIQLGEKLTRGLGAGGNPEVGEKSAEETRQVIHEVVSGADMVFLTAGMGGGTGTGSIQVVSDIAKESGALTIAIVTKPFCFEGQRRRRVAEEAILKLAPKVDTLIIINNDRLMELVDQKASVDVAFRYADDVLKMAVQAISEVVTVPGLINLDFADIRSIMHSAGPAWMSVGRGSGQTRAADAAKAALQSPLLDCSISGAKGVLYNITGGNNLTLYECNDAAAVIQGAVDPDANIIFGVVFDERMKDEVQITLIATGFTTHYGGSVPTEAELRKMIGSENQLDVPSFIRNRGVPRPAYTPRPAATERPGMPASRPSMPGR